MLKPADFELLSLLVATQFEKEPMSVDRLVERLGVSQSLASQRLGRLHKQGLLERTSLPTATGRVVHYKPKPLLFVQWVSPAQRVALQWQGFDETDWMFPLVSQVPDPPARVTLLSFLHRLRERNLLLPGPFTAGKKAAPHFGLGLLAYGSCARGTARPGSDLDLISVQDGSKEAVDVGQDVETISAEVSLSAPRPIQLKHVRADELANLPEGIRGSLRREGVVVHDGLRSETRGPSRRLFTFVYGGRGPADL